MQITLNQEEIEMAISNYVRGQINIVDSAQIAIELRAGRGENGFTASLDIRSVLTPAVAAPKAVTRTTAPAAEEAPVQERVVPTPAFPAFNTRKERAAAPAAPAAPAASEADAAPVKNLFGSPSDASAIPEPAEALPEEAAGENNGTTGGIFSFGVKS